MSPKEFLRLWAQLQIKLRANRTQQVLLVGRESLALIRRRVQNTGMDADGQSFGFYSAQYEEVRERNAFQTDFIDLTLTGGMWQETGVELVSDEEGVSIATVQGRTARAAKLLRFNSQRYGDLLQPSDEEEEQVSKAYFERTINFIQNFLDQ